MLDAPRELVGAGALTLAQKRHLRAEVRGVADVGDPVEGEARQQPDRHRAPGVDVVAEAAAEHELGEVPVLDAHHALEHDDAGVDRALGKLELADVALGEGHVFAVAGFRPPDQHEFAAGPGAAQPRSDRGGKLLAVAPSQQAARIHHPRPDHLRAGVDEAGAADAGRGRRADHAAVHVLVDPDVLDGPDRAAHPVADLRPFEGRSGRGGAGHEPVLRAHDHLAVGADVHEGAQRFALVDPGGEHAGHGVRPDEARHDRQQAHLRVRRGLERQLAGGDDDAVAHRRRIGCEPHVRHVDAEEDVVHARVADHHDLVEVVAGDAGAGARFLDEVVDRVQHLGAQGGELLLVELGVGDARHEVAAVDGLGVDAAHRGQLLPGIEVHERPHDAGGADVERHAVGVPGGVAGLDVDDPAVEGGDGQRAALLAQLPGDLAHHRERDAPGGRGIDGRQHLGEIRGLVVLLARDVRDDDVLLHARVEREAGAVHHSGAGRIAAGEDLVARLGLRRQGHDLAVGHRARLAAEPEPLPHLLVAELEGVLHGGRGHVPGEDLAAAAPAAPARAAGRLHADTRRPRRVEQRGAAPDARPAHRLRAVRIDESDFDQVRFRHPVRTP